MDRGTAGDRVGRGRVEHLHVRRVLQQLDDGETDGRRALEKRRLGAFDAEIVDDDLVNRGRCRLRRDDHFRRLFLAREHDSTDAAAEEQYAGGDIQE